MRDPRRQRGSGAGPPGGGARGTQARGGARTRGDGGRQPARANGAAPSTLPPHAEPAPPSPGSRRSNPRGSTGPPHAASSCGRRSRGRGIPAAKKAGRDQVGSSAPTLAEGGRAGASRGLQGPGGRGDLTWPAPQSHASPSSTKPLPQRARRTASPEPGVLERHEPPPLRKKARSWRRLQALNTRGNGCLRAGEGVGACRDHRPERPLLSDPSRTPRARPHNCSNALGAEPRVGK